MSNYVNGSYIGKNASSTFLVLSTRIHQSSGFHVSKEKSNATFPRERTEAWVNW